ncbi:TPA: hypothetical protein ACM5ML_003133, partial [Escherichia coli]
MMQPVINAPEIATAREQQLFNGKNFHVFIGTVAKLAMRQPFVLFKGLT